ncbi:MAG TPA: nucleoside recognition domain-containing protein [Cyclobacteriaceae bacterium]|nr:nucleoside recognition domain-containing protein [Cyclobacteriaceae bacterium]HRW99592.1 nucleoside recognition domain-containing protein [Cyclobacteriaceae bacterium]
MILNYIWVSFFLLAFAVAVVKLFFFQDMEVFPQMLNSTFDMAKTGFEISLYLTGVMSLWLGIMKIGERSGIVAILSRWVGPFFSKLFPGIPTNHPATGSIIMNFSANMLGLDNAATPLGLKAMKEMQELNTDKETASNAQIMFLALNTSGFTIIPLAIILDRSILGAANPTDIFIPTLIATSISSLAALIVVSLYQKINLLNSVVLSYLMGFSLIIGGSVYYFTTLNQDQLTVQSNLISSFIIITVIISFLILGLIKKVPLFETFVEGAKEGFETSIKIIPYLIAILVSIGVFRASGTLDYFTGGIGWMVAVAGMNTDFVDALPVAFLKPLSGGAAKGMMVETIKTYGPDSFVGRLASILRGCTETTFYILAVYFGSVNIRKTRYALTVGLIADLVGVITGIFVAYLFFH